MFAGLVDTGLAHGWLLGTAFPAVLHPLLRALLPRMLISTQQAVQAMLFASCSPAQQARAYTLDPVRMLTASYMSSPRAVSTSGQHELILHPAESALGSLLGQCHNGCLQVGCGTGK